MEINKIAVLGAGIMGSGIAQVASMSGFQVVVRDVKDDFLESGRSKVEGSLQKMVKKEKITDDESRQIQDNIKWTTDIGGLSGAELLIEAVPEVEELKKEMYRATEKLLAEDAIIASNTSSISISLLGSAVSNPDRFIGMHWFNPAVIMKLVEIVRGVATSDETVNTIVNLCEKMGKETIVCRDCQGFITTRILTAFRLECYRAYEEGIASKEDIDKACRLAFGHPMGQFELADFSGLDIEVNALKGMVEVYGDRFRPPQQLLNIVRAGRLGRKSKHGWYDYE
ncbi:MAG: 3-hydroxyacyl-CoA dehydrogenase family protein [Desulfobacteraceae bacterium]|jgi:3-hydroxybutyryl-CoA dehydrogenase|nr:MAG: 3-hydroxyacyl-CoA dehydrogenase family protein [Desulfobacteraceae bacterium]